MEKEYQKFLEKEKAKNHFDEHLRRKPLRRIKLIVAGMLHSLGRMNDKVFRLKFSKELKNDSFFSQMSD